MSPQPLLAGRSVALCAPMQVWSAADGQLDGHAPGRTVEGIYRGDERIVGRVMLSVDDLLVEPLVAGAPEGGEATFDYLVRAAADDTPDPALLLPAPVASGMSR